MKLEEIRKDYERYSTKVSDLNRKLIFTGIAIIWLFRVSNQYETSIPECLYCPLLLFVLSLIADITQYFSQSICWYIYYCIKKKSKQDNTTEEDIERSIVKEPEWPNYIFWFIWGIKPILTLIAYILLGVFLYPSQH